MIQCARRLAAHRAGSAAAEMVLVMPVLLTLMFGAFELGNYFLSEHVVQKGVRDAARYAARLPISSYPACVPTSTAEQQIRRVARTGDPDGTTQRINGWTSDATVTVTVACSTGTYQGVFTESPIGTAVVTVSASVPYPSLFGVIGLGNPSLSLNAQSQAAVFGA